jgi:hypothetical protein
MLGPDDAEMFDDLLAGNRIDIGQNHDFPPVGIEKIHLLPKVD